MPYHISYSNFDEETAVLRILGRTPSEAKNHARSLLQTVQSRDPSALFGTPAYEGFSSELGRHVYRLQVIYGVLPALTETVLRSLV